VAQQDLTRPLAYSEGIHYMHTNPKGTQQIMKKFLKCDDKSIEEAYREVVLKAAPRSHIRQ
jgi:hypothetical protein